MSNSKNLFLVSLCLTAIFSCNALDNQEYVKSKTLISWKDWKARYGKTYTAEEEQMRRAIWAKNRMLIKEYNARPDTTFKLDLNAFADKVMTEIPKTRLDHLVESRYQQGSCPSAVPSPLPSSFDWRTRGGVPPVSSQGQMGSSAVIVVEKSIESYNTIQSGHLVTASLEEVYQCCSKPSVRTLPGQLFDCIINKLHGLCSEADYPSSGNGSCLADRCQPTVKVGDYNVVFNKSEKSLMVELLQTPVVVTIDASHASFQLYRSGVYQEKNCGSTLDHNMLLVGYGVQQVNGEEVDYWVCQNTWGYNWGMNGYILIARNHGNMCGIASAAYRPC